MRGAALLITLLIIGILATVLLGASRLTIREIRSARAFADSTGAYFAAESGIEDGLMRIRRDRDYELPAAATRTSTQGQRINLGTNQDLGAVTVSSGSLNPNQSFYDLKIWFKDAQIGDLNLFSSGQSSTFETILKDSIRELSGFTTNTQLEFRIESDTPGANTGLEIRTLNPAGGGVTSFNPLLSSGAVGPFTVSVGAGERLLLHAFGGDIRFAARPLATTVFDSGIHHVEATGYFGGVKRKLEAIVDRESGTVIGLFDYTVFSGSGSL